MSEWRQVPLGDLCDRLTVGHVGKMADQYVDAGISYLRSQDIKPFMIDESGMLKIGAEFHRRLAKSTLRDGDVVVVRTGYPGIAAVVPPQLDGANCSDVVIVTPSADLNPHFLTGILNSSWGRAAVRGNLVGAAQQHFNVGSARNLRITVPERATQDRIAGVLCAFNDLIENNQRRIRLLEQMAQAMYREWFIHFNHAGREGELVASTIGPIPSTWDVRALFDEAEVAFGFALKSKGFGTTGAWPVIRIRDVLAGSTATFTDEFPGARYIVENGDALIGMDGDFHMNRWSGGDALLNQRVTRIRPAGRLGPEALFRALREPISRWNESIVGTTVAHLGKSHLEAISLPVPPGEIAAAINKALDPLGETMLRLRRANGCLVLLRNALLPKLVTGEIDVSHLDLDDLLEDTAA